MSLSTRSQARLALIRAGCRPWLRAATLASSLIVMALATPAGATVTETFGGPGGSPFVSSCPSGMAMAGMRAATGAWVDSVSILCGRFDHVTKRLQTPYWVHARAGGKGGSSQERYCDGARPVTGITLTHTIGNGLERQYVNSIGLICGDPNRIEQCIGSGEGCDLVSKTTTTTVILPISKTRKYKNDKLLCGQGEVALGLKGRAGDYVDAIALWCGPPPKVVGQH